MTTVTRRVFPVRSRCLLVAFAIVWLAGPLAAAASAQDAQLTRGRQIVERQCARCHATGRTGASPLAKAPAFRVLSKRYPLESLAEALAEGIVTGHNAMPHFRFPPDDIDAILAWMAAISEP